ncbi:MAG: hypothetical protein AB7O65_09380, partial [Candidatus Korobacteraceae bacterium]
MENANGTNAKWKQHQDIFPDMRREFAESDTEHTTSVKPPKQETGKPPAKTFQYGRILTCIWANPTHWGGVDWRVEQTRNTHPGTGAFSRNFCPQDLQDARRGLLDA